MRKITAPITLLAVLAGSLTAATSTFTIDDTSDIGAATVFYEFDRDGASAANPTSVIADKTLDINGALNGTSVLRFRTEITSGTDALFLHNITGASIDPSSAAITGIDYYIETIETNSGSNTAIYFGLLQGGNTYLYSNGSSTAVDFRPSGTGSFDVFDLDGLDNSDFGLFAGAGSASGQYDDVSSGSNPDFTIAGSAIQFVFGTFSSSGGASTRHTGFNRNAEIMVSTVPETAAYPLLAGMLAIAAVTFRRRRL